MYEEYGTIEEEEIIEKEREHKACHRCPDREKGIVF
jgi:hypothetical protein